MFFVHGPSFLLRLAVALIIYKPHAGACPCCSHPIPFNLNPNHHIPPYSSLPAADVLSKGSFEGKSLPACRLYRASARHHPTPLPDIISAVRNFSGNPPAAGPPPVAVLFKFAMCVMTMIMAIMKMWLIRMTRSVLRDLHAAASVARLVFAWQLHSVMLCACLSSGTRRSCCGGRRILWTWN